MGISSDMLIGKDIESRPKNIINAGITWVDGRLLFKNNKRQGQGYYGICHYSEGVWAVTPLDFKRVEMLTSIQVSPTEDYCEKAFSCLNVNCPLNRYNKDMYCAEFADCGEFSLGLPRNLGKDNPPWFCNGEWRDKWKGFIIQVLGGRLEFDEEKAKKILNE